MFKKLNKGFTLVEVMIVVGIIAILAGIFLVGSGQFRISANVARMKADLQKIEALQELCATRNDGTYAASNGDLETCVSITLPTSPLGTDYVTTDTNTCAPTLPASYDSAWPSGDRCLTR